MASAFEFSKPVTGKNNIGHRPEQQILANLIAQGENVVVYEPPKSGKASLISQTFLDMRLAKKPFTNVEVSLLNVRTVADFCLRLGSAVTGACAMTPGEYSDMVDRYLRGSHFVFDEEQYATSGRILSLGWDIDDGDIASVLDLPYRVARDKGQKLVVVLSEFQNIMLTEDWEKVLDIMDAMFKSLPSESKQHASFIMTGSGVNAMKYIFVHRHYFHRYVTRVELKPLEPREIVDHVIRGFLAGGKVLDRELMLGVCRLFRCNMWYINHFCAECDALSKGYIMEPVLEEALEMVLSVNEPRFVDMMNGLTTFQVCLLRAIVDGNTKFSSADVIRRYSLNSSANVRRLKDALCKKEIVTFNEDDEPVILDPLFEYWVTRKYFEIKTA